MGLLNQISALFNELTGSVAAQQSAARLLPEEIGTGEGFFQSSQIGGETFKKLLRGGDASVAHQQ